MVAIIAGLGTALPTAAIATAEFIAHAKQYSCQTPRQERVLEELYRRTSIETRSSVLAAQCYGTRGELLFKQPSAESPLGPSTEERMLCYAKEVVPLAIASAQRAMENACVDSPSITHLVTVSCTGFYAPGFDIALINQLPLPPTTARTNVGFMGCHGAMNALRVCQSFAQSDPESVILLCATELCSLHFQYGWESTKLLANSLFSDGSASLIIRNAKESIRGEWTLIDSTSLVVNNSLEAMEWRVGDHGFQMRLSSQVPELVETVLPSFMHDWLAKFDLKTTDIAGWAVHPGGPRILDVVQSCLTLPSPAMQPAREVLAKCGNMSSPTTLFILEHLRANQITGPCVMLGFGPGLTIEAALLEMT